jgi:SAM-dependent methyltransferase
VPVSETVRTAIPEPIRKAARWVQGRFVRKDDAELSFWRTRPRRADGRLDNSHYERRMLAMAERPDAAFLDGKVVADFGCGPRGSLLWAGPAAIRIGIDVLSDRYADEFAEDITSHGMIYVTSTERVIPLPSGLVDVMFTLNAMDHVDDFPRMCDEIVRVMRPGGEFIGSFNLGEPASSTEPQRLNESVIEEHLLSKLEVISYRLSGNGPADDRYGPLVSGELLPYREGQEGTLWVRARKS